MVPQRSVLDALLLGEWEDRAEAGLFRYDVTACPTKLVPGSYGFIAQCNEGRLSKKRPTEFRIDQVAQPFDDAKFNFKKALQKEVLFMFEPAASGRGGRAATKPSFQPAVSGWLCGGETPRCCCHQSGLPACLLLGLERPARLLGPTPNQLPAARRGAASANARIISPLPCPAFSPSLPSPLPPCCCRWPPAPPPPWCTSMCPPSSMATYCWCPAHWTTCSSWSRPTPCCWRCSLRARRVSGDGG